MEQKYGGTLADLIEDPAGELPRWLQFRTHPEDGIDRQYESFIKGYDGAALRMQEAKGGRAAVKLYFIDTANNPDSRSFEDFEAKGYNTVGINKKSYQDAAWAFKKLSAEELKGSAGDAAMEAEAPVTDDRPEFDPNAEGADPLLARIMKKRAEKADAVVESVKDSVDEKYNKVYNAARYCANGKALKHHVFICGDAGVGKSYSVEAAIEDGLKQWKPNKRQPTKPDLVKVHGSIGNGMTNLLLFFWKNRENKLILLDDADGFIMSTDQDIQNFLKGMLDPDMHAVTTSITIRSRANQLLQKEWEETQKKLSEANGDSVFSVDTSHLAEGWVACNINGETFAWDTTLNESIEIAKTFGCPSIVNKYKENMSRKGKQKYNIYGELIRESIDDDDSGLSDEEEAILQGIADDDNFDASGLFGDDMLLDTECPQIEAAWYFKSSLILISNLQMSDVNEAVRSRCQCVELTLTRPEFMCHCEEILKHIKVGDDSSNDPVLIEWAKKESFQVFKTIILSQGFKNTGLEDIQVRVPLQFRMIGEFTGAWLSRYDMWCDKNGIQDPENPEHWKEAEEAILLKFVDYDMKGILAGDTRTKKGRRG